MSRVFSSVHSFVFDSSSWQNFLLRITSSSRAALRAWFSSRKKSFSDWSVAFSRTSGFNFRTCFTSCPCVFSFGGMLSMYSHRSPFLLVIRSPVSSQIWISLILQLMRSIILLNPGCSWTFSECLSLLESVSYPTMLLLMIPRVWFSVCIAFCMAVSRSRWSCFVWIRVYFDSLQVAM